MKDFSKFFGHKANDERKQVRCVFCGKYVLTASDIDRCSRKGCKRTRRSKSKDGMQECISYDDALIERKLT